MGGNISMRVLARVVVGVALALTMAACGLGAPDAQGPGGPPDAPVLDLAAIRTLEVGAHREIGVTETGLYTVTEDAVVGFAPDGTRQWTLRKDGARPDTDRVRPVLFQPVLLVGWEGTPGLVAYSTETGEQLWSTAAEEWTQGDTADGTVTFADARTGTQAWSVSLASFGCPPTEDALVPVWIRDVVLIRCHTATGPDGKGADQWVAALDPRDGAVRWQRQLTGGDHVAVESRNTLAVKLSSGETDVLDITTGEPLARRPAAPGSRYRLPRPDGVSLVMDSTTLAENTAMRLEEADGRVRWTAPLDEREEVLPLTAAVSSNVLLATMRKRLGDNAVSLVAYDMGDGTRTLVAGPGPSVRDEQPTLTMALARRDNPTMAPWGLLVPGADGTVAVVPAE
ncbi:PQQ-binding-like beta-propeller repeat protein [Nocardia farcinica]|uniref:PQQ enzyme repeat n=1 Tax=Nocardia farcinica TaxID=37329 RepID=A0A0H5P7Z0_NOCFR|nr:PQQ-binding-like beta-propeller repeat protein [Nocardia farcinica]AXK88418.1 hypothetical protein DXT66_24880 [Nocardia farcinica]CRY83930.1 PQQ enzyme repeat [Nocardia farcinica]